MITTAAHPDIGQIWAWLSEIPDPEIPVLSIRDLGIVRAVLWSSSDPDLCIVTVTPTYSGCPAIDVIADEIRKELLQRGISRVELRTQLSPAWTTDWLTETGRNQLREYGIAPPTHLVQITPRPQSAQPACPHCGSLETEIISHFGSTPCKSLHRCLACMEPFDYFKPH